MKITYITPAKYAKFILGETRRYCGKCGKVFDLLDAKLDNVKRCYSPCCDNMINNEIICTHDANGDCPYGKDFQPDCGTSCKNYKPNN